MIKEEQVEESEESRRSKKRSDEGKKKPRKAAYDLEWYQPLFVDFSLSLILYQFMSRLVLLMAIIFYDSQEDTQTHHPCGSAEEKLLGKQLRIGNVPGLAAGPEERLWPMGQIFPKARLRHQQSSWWGQASHPGDIHCRANEGKGVGAGSFQVDPILRAQGPWAGQYRPPM